MRVEVRPADAEGDPAAAVVAGLHGDEPCGVRAVEGLLAADLDFRRPAALVVANEAALARGVRYVDADCNRSFPGDPDADAHEARLAARLRRALGDVPVLDLHATVSHPEPFALLGRVTPATARLARAAGVSRVVDASHEPGGLVGHVDGVAVECGYKGTAEAAANARRVARRFLGALGVLQGEGDAGGREPDPVCYRITGDLAVEADEFLGENFRRVDAGEAFVRLDGEPVRADGAFYPVLASADGYEDRLGYRAERAGRLSAVVGNG